MSLLLLPLPPFVIQVSRPHGHSLYSSLTKLLYALLIAILHSIPPLHQTRNITVPRTFCLFFFYTETREKLSELRQSSCSFRVISTVTNFPSCIFFYLFQIFEAVITVRTAHKTKKNINFSPQFTSIKAITQNSLKVYKLNFWSRNYFLKFSTLCI